MRTNSEQRTHTAHTQHVAVAVALADDRDRRRRRRTRSRTTCQHAQRRPRRWPRRRLPLTVNLVGAVADVIVRLVGSSARARRSRARSTSSPPPTASDRERRGHPTHRRARPPQCPRPRRARRHRLPRSSRRSTRRRRARHGSGHPGPSGRVGMALPACGEVTLAGFQPIDSDGTLLRGHRPATTEGCNRKRTALPYAPAGCVEPVDALDVSAARVMVPCGLVPGRVRWRPVRREHGELVLVGILSTVTADQSANGVVPLASAARAARDPDQYVHGFHVVGASDTGLAPSGPERLQARTWSRRGPADRFASSRTRCGQSAVVAIAVSVSSAMIAVDSRVLGVRRHGDERAARRVVAEERPWSPVPR